MSSPSSSGSRSPSTGKTSPISTESEFDKESGYSIYGANLPPVPNASDGKVLKPLDVDASTPDAWVARDERMIRLTGKHPYNVEAPLTDLWKAGFLTPQSLFYVRSHGATPRISEQEADRWTLKVHGLVEEEVEFSISDLKQKFETVTLPVTLVCAGNRRKEQNMVAKGLGFNWGAAGVSTGLFTGVYLADVLEYCRPIKPRGAFPYDREAPGCARHVIFEGCDELPRGKYGTSQRIQWARDRSKGMLIAWGLNGEALTPDHGYPLRLVVPGQIGGRMVKWLNRIEVSDRESQHYLHFWDNKVLPTHVTADQARKEEHWWYDPKYIINDLNVNAAITVPAHGARLDLKKAGTTTKVAGYAYTGGGKRVHRVEITLDEGQTWQIATLDWPEDLYRIEPIRNHPYYGTLDLTETEMSFSWCFWEAEIPTEIFSKATSVAVRATDEGLAAMPRDMYWNAMSMMNNWWFRVAINHNAEDIRSFEHPTQAGNGPGGWMERFNEENKDVRNPHFGDTKSSSTASSQQEAVPKVGEADVDALMRQEGNMDKIISAEALKEHANESKPWFVVNGHVFDGTEFLEKHPGGAESITLVAGEDATEDFMAIHSIDAKAQMRDFHIGKLAPSAKAITAEQDAQPNADGTFLNPKHWKKSRLVSKAAMSHDSYMFRFAMDHEDQEVGLPIGQHVYIRVHAKDQSGQKGELIQRAYTPFSSNDQRGFLDILIKVYRPSAEFPTGGKMTCSLEKLVPGQDSVEIKGPLGHFIYEPGSIMRVHKKPRKVRNVAMIAGGSGITPIWSTLKGIIQDANASETNIWVLNANRTESDILARTQLEDLINAANARIKLWHILSSKYVDAQWSMGRGRISLDCLRNHLPPAPRPIDDDDGNPAEDTIALLCGPGPMEEVVLKGLKDLGWDTARNVVRF